jgi:RND family efflux transporter MFP subunit
MMRKAFIAGALLLSACSGSSNDEAPAAPVALVSLDRVEKGVMTQTVTLYGVVEIVPAARHVLAAPSEAIVESVDAPAGTRVLRGDLIARLRPSPATRLDLDKANSDARAADLAYGRAQRLRKDGLVGDSELETAQAAALAADATRASLVRRGEALNLRAPAAGYVEALAANPGDVLAAGSAVATIVQISDVRAHFGIDSALLRQVGPGASLLLAPSAGGAPVGSRILSLSPIVDAQTRLASLFASIPPDAGLHAGVPLTASLALTAANDTLTIPYSALLDDGGQPFVFAVADGIAHRRDVVIGAAAHDRMVIFKGLNAGEAVVTQGGTAVADGMKVRIK